MIRKFAPLLTGIVLGASVTLVATNPNMGGSAIAAVSDIYRQLNLFGDVFEKVRSDYVEKPDD